MKLLASNKSKITKDRNGENVPHLEITEIILVYCYIANNDYQQDAFKLLLKYTFIPDKSFGQLQDISPKNFLFLKALYSDFSYIEVWFSH